MHRIVHVYSSIVALDSLVASIGPFIQHSYLHVCWCYNIIQYSMHYSQKLCYIIHLDSMLNCSYNTASRLCIANYRKSYVWLQYIFNDNTSECVPENVNTNVQLAIIATYMHIIDVWFEQCVLQ